MKKILFLTALALVALVSSCKKEEDPKPEELIIGRWKANKAFVGSTDVLIPTSTLKPELEIEFTASKTIAFIRKYTHLDTNPPTVSESTLNGVYSLNGNILTITVTSGSDTRTVTGPIDLTEDHFVFTATSGDTTDFYSMLEAHKL